MWKGRYQRRRPLRRPRGAQARRTQAEFFRPGRLATGHAAAAPRQPLRPPAILLTASRAAGRLASHRYGKARADTIRTQIINRAGTPRPPCPPSTCICPHTGHGNMAGKRCSPPLAPHRPDCPQPTRSGVQSRPTLGVPNRTTQKRLAPRPAGPPRPRTDQDRELLANQQITTQPNLVGGSRLSARYDPSNIDLDPCQGSCGAHPQTCAPVMLRPW